MAYELLNLLDGDVLTSEHIQHLENGLKEIENTADTMKEKLVAILGDKDIVATTDEELSEIIKKFTYLKNPDIPQYEYSEDIIDIRNTVQSGQIQMVSLDTATVGFYITATNGFIVDWGDGKTNTYTSTSGTQVTHTYSKGTGQYYDGTSTQFIITVIPSLDGHITRFTSYTTNQSSYNNQILAFAAKDVYFENISSMFYWMTKLQYIDIIGGSLGTSDLNTDMQNFARECQNLKRISSNVCWNSVTNMAYAFYDCYMLSEINFGDSWDTRNCNSFHQAFYNCKLIETIPAFITSSTISMTSTFYGCQKLISVNGDSWDLTNCTSLAQCFYNCNLLQTLPYIQNTNNVITAYSMFNNCNSLVKLHEKQLKLDLSSVTEAYFMFCNCSSLEEAPELTLTSATDVHGLFDGCSSLYIIQEVFELPYVTGVNANQYNGDPRTGMEGMFRGCSTLTNAPQIIAPQVITVKSLFSGCSNLTNVPEYYSFPECQLADYLFNGCSLLQTLPNIEIPKAIYARYLFKDCSSLKVAPYSNEGESFELPEAVYVDQMFMNDSSLQTAPYSLVLPKATCYTNMFSGCTSLITAPHELSMGSATNINSLFENCESMMNPPNKISAPKATSANRLFYMCRSMIVCPELELPVCTSATECFRYCHSLTSTIPYHFEKMNNITSFYRDCKSLSVIEEIVSDATILNISSFASGNETSNLIRVAFPKCTNGHIIWGSINDSTPVWAYGGYSSSLKTYTNAIDVFSSVFNLSNYILGSDYLEGTVTLSGLKSALTITNKPYLTGFRLENPQENMANLTITNCALDTEAINQLFTDLPTVKTARVISIKGNPGAESCNTSIATAKNWTVVTV